MQLYRASDRLLNNKTLIEDHENVENLIPDLI